MRAVVLAAALCCAAAPAFAVQDTAPSRLDGRIRTVAYSAQNVTRIYVGTMNSTAINFGPDEEIIDVGLGDSLAYLTTQAKGAPNILLIKPSEPRSTVMHVFTRGKDGAVKPHQFDVIVVPASLQVADGSGAVPTFRAPDLTVNVAYPEQERQRRAAEAAQRREEYAQQRAEVMQAQSHLTGPLNYAYTACGNGNLDPLEVFDNGRATTFRWPSGKPVPVLYTTGVDGQDGIPVQQSSSGDLVTVYQVSHRWVLRLGDAVDCVRMAPSAWQAHQMRLAAGLAPPGVQRRIVRRRVVPRRVAPAVAAAPASASPAPAAVAP